MRPKSSHWTILLKDSKRSASISKELSSESQFCQARVLHWTDEVNQDGRVKSLAILFWCQVQVWACWTPCIPWLRNDFSGFHNIPNSSIGLGQMAVADGIVRRPDCHSADWSLFEGWPWPTWKDCHRCLSRSHWCSCSCHWSGWCCQGWMVAIVVSSHSRIRSWRDNIWCYCHL